MRSEGNVFFFAAATLIPANSNPSPCAASIHHTLRNSMWRSEVEKGDSNFRDSGSTSTRHSDDGPPAVILNSHAALQVGKNSNA